MSLLKRELILCGMPTSALVLRQEILSQTAASKSEKVEDIEGKRNRNGKDKKRKKKTRETKRRGRKEQRGEKMKKGDGKRERKRWSERTKIKTVNRYKKRNIFTVIRKDRIFELI